MSSLGKRKGDGNSTSGASVASPSFDSLSSPSKRSKHRPLTTDTSSLKKLMPESASDLGVASCSNIGSATAFPVKVPGDSAAVGSPIRPTTTAAVHSGPAIAGPDSNPQHLSKIESAGRISGSASPSSSLENDSSTSDTPNTIILRSVNRLTFRPPPGIILTIDDDAPAIPGFPADYWAGVRYNGHGRPPSLHYQILSEEGRGQAEVYRARNVRKNESGEWEVIADARPVAVKLWGYSLLDDWNEGLRLEKETEGIEGVSSAKLLLYCYPGDNQFEIGPTQKINIQNEDDEELYEVGQTFSTDQHVIVLELHKSLDKELRTCSWARMAHLLLPAYRLLLNLNEHGIRLKDVKPSNLVVLCDWEPSNGNDVVPGDRVGFIDGGSFVKTGPENLIDNSAYGTVAYMSPMGMWVLIRQLWEGQAKKGKLPEKWTPAWIVSWRSKLQCLASEGWILRDDVWSLGVGYLYILLERLGSPTDLIDDGYDSPLERVMRAIDDWDGTGMVCDDPVLLNEMISEVIDQYSVIFGEGKRWERPMRYWKPWQEVLHEMLAVPEAFSCDWSGVQGANLTLFHPSPPPPIEDRIEKLIEWANKSKLTTKNALVRKSFNNSRSMSSRRSMLTQLNPSLAPSGFSDSIRGSASETLSLPRTPDVTSDYDASFPLSGKTHASGLVVSGGRTEPSTSSIDTRLDGLKASGRGSRRKTAVSFGARINRKELELAAAESKELLVPQEHAVESNSKDVKQPLIMSWSPNSRGRTFLESGNILIKQPNGSIVCELWATADPQDSNIRRVNVPEHFVGNRTLWVCGHPLCPYLTANRHPYCTITRTKLIAHLNSCPFKGHKILLQEEQEEPSVSRISRDKWLTTRGFLAGFIKR